MFAGQFSLTASVGCDVVTGSIWVLECNVARYDMA